VIPLAKTVPGCLLEVSLTPPEFHSPSSALLRKEQDSKAEPRGIQKQVRDDHGTIGNVFSSLGMHFQAGEHVCKARCGGLGKHSTLAVLTASCISHSFAAEPFVPCRAALTHHSASLLPAPCPKTLTGGGPETQQSQTLKTRRQTLAGLCWVAPWAGGFRLGCGTPGPGMGLGAYARISVRDESAALLELCLLSLQFESMINKTSHRLKQ